MWPSDMREHRTEQAITILNQLADHLLYDEISEYEYSKLNELQEAVIQLQTTLNELKLQQSVIAQWVELNRAKGQ